MLTIEAMIKEIDLRKANHKNLLKQVGKVIAYAILAAISAIMGALFKQ
jgi:LPS O-antigen subunit length determinant protein (WzzB/FepE family)